jgi:hypothetical protein
MSEKNNDSEKIQFLYSAISDAQELIKFTDTKVAFATTLFGALLIGFYNQLMDIIEYFNQFSWELKIVGALLLISFIIIGIIVTTILFPNNKAHERLDLPNDFDLPIEFYLFKNSYSCKFPFFKPKKRKLKSKFKKHLNSISGITSESIIQILDYELHKVSYIRNLKNDRFKILVICLMTSTILFFVSIVLFKIELISLIVAKPH